MREAVLHGVTRFAEFQKRLEAPRSTLSARLSQFTAAGLLMRETHSRGTEYRLTDSGRDFLGCLLIAMRWGDQWYFRPDTRPQKGTHTPCGSPLEAVLRCAHCREVLRAREVTTSPGHPFTEIPISVVKGARRRRPGLELLERSRPCSIARTLMVMGEWWSALIVRECFFGTRRFDEFQRRLNIAPNILSERLQRLVALGIIAKVADNSWAVRHEYRLTDNGADRGALRAVRMQPRSAGGLSQGLSLVDAQMELLVPADQQAVHPLRVMVGVEPEVLGLLKEFGEHGAGLYARECGSDAEMDAVPECQVALGGSPPQVDAIGVVELGRISIPGSEEQQGRGSCCDIDTAQCGVVGHAAQHVPKWRFEPQGFFHEHVNVVGSLA